MVVISVSPLVKLQTPKLLSTQLTDLSTAQVFARCVRPGNSSPKLLKLLTDTEVIDVQPGTQEQDFSPVSNGHKKRGINPPFYQLWSKDSIT
jgi:hypothetical protein